MIAILLGYLAGSVPFASPMRTRKVVAVVPRFEVMLSEKSIALLQRIVVSTVIRKLSPAAVPWGAMAP